MNKKFKHIHDWAAFESDEVFTNKSGEKFWGDVGAGVLPVCKSTGRILVAYRSKHVNEPNTWGVFGGQIDDPENESPMEAAKRELREESGKADIKIELIPAYVYKSGQGGFKYHNFVGLVENEFKPILDWETESAEWMTLDKLLNIKPKHFGMQALLDNSLNIIKKYAKLS